MNINSLIIAAIAILNTAVTAIELYKVKDYTPGAGSITLTATKEYNTLDYTGNTTLYRIDIVSELIRNPGQEIRVAIQWLWNTKLGPSN